MQRTKLHTRMVLIRIFRWKYSLKIEIVPWEQGRAKLNPGEGYLTKLDNKLAMWYCCHLCKEIILISDHAITQNPDGTLTVTPSLVCPTAECTGHYFITNSEIK